MGQMSHFRVRGWWKWAAAVVSLIVALGMSAARGASNGTETYDLVIAKGRVMDPESGLDAIRNVRSEEHTSELQSHLNLVCRLLLEKKKKLNGNESNSLNVSVQATHERTPLAS